MQNEFECLDLNYITKCHVCNGLLIEAHICKECYNFKCCKIHLNNISESLKKNCLHEKMKPKLIKLVGEAKVTCNKCLDSNIKYCDFEEHKKNHCSFLCKYCKEKIRIADKLRHTNYCKGTTYKMYTVILVVGLLGFWLIKKYF
jgi:hypothetical protein